MILNLVESVNFFAIWPGIAQAAQSYPVLLIYYVISLYK